MVGTRGRGRRTRLEARRVVTFDGMWCDEYRLVMTVDSPGEIAEIASIDAANSLTHTSWSARTVGSGLLGSSPRSRCRSEWSFQSGIE